MLPVYIFNVSMVTQHLDVEAELVDVQLVGVHLEPLGAEPAVSPVLPEVAVHAVVLHQKVNTNLIKNVTLSHHVRVRNWPHTSDQNAHFHVSRA